MPLISCPSSQHVSPTHPIHHPASWLWTAFAPWLPSWAAALHHTQGTWWGMMVVFHCMMCHALHMHVFTSMPTHSMYVLTPTHTPPIHSTTCAILIERQGDVDASIQQQAFKCLLATATAVGVAACIQGMMAGVLHLNAHIREQTLVNMVNVRVMWVWCGCDEGVMCVCGIHVVCVVLQWCVVIAWCTQAVCTITHTTHHTPHHPYHSSYTTSPTPPTRCCCNTKHPPLPGSPWCHDSHMWHNTTATHACELRRCMH